MMPIANNSKITIIDYGAGNLKNLKNAFDFLKAPAEITNEITRIKNATKMVLPGVGAFDFAMKNLKAQGLDEIILKKVQAGVPLFGICLGMQLLFTSSEEGGAVTGLNLIPGQVKRFQIQEKVPHIGWNTLIPKNDSPLIRELPAEAYAYFVHSYHCVPTDANHIVTETDYEIRFTSMIHKDNVMGAQFHPEKSQEVGLNILQNFVEL